MKILYLSYERNIDLEKEHEVMYYDVDHRVGQEPIKKFKPDLVIEREFNDNKAIYSDLLDFIKKELPDTKRAVWLIDTHVSEGRHKTYAKYFDYVFLAISKYVNNFRLVLRSKNVYWLPLCYPFSEDTIDTTKQVLKKYPITFVGRWDPKWFPERTLYINALKLHYRDDFTAVTDYNNMSSILSQSQISFNCSISDDLNFRIFESLGLGAQLVTNDVPDIHKIKGLEERIHIYHNFEDCVREIEKIRIAKEIEDYRQWVKDNHTLKTRLNSMLKMISTNTQEEF